MTIEIPRIGRRMVYKARRNSTKTTLYIVSSYMKVIALPGQRIAIGGEASTKKSRVLDREEMEFETSVTRCTGLDVQGVGSRSKRCSRCQELKLAEAFAKSTRESSGFQSWCKECLMDYGRRRPKVHFPTVKHKMCSSCRIMKVAQEFCKDIHKPTGLRSQCRECRRRIRAERKTQETQLKTYKTKRNTPSEKRRFDVLLSDASNSRFSVANAQTNHLTPMEQTPERRCNEVVIKDPGAMSLRQWALLTAADLASVDTL